MGRPEHPIGRRLTPATSGTGPLLQRDYWAFVEAPRCRASQVGNLLATELPSLAPSSYVRFRRTDGSEAPLEVGDELDATIRFAGTFGVRVVHKTPNSITLGTLEGHPEAGRITFGAYRSDDGDLIFHIRSRARSSSSTRYAGFLAIGESLQTNAWGELIKRFASWAGNGVLGVVHEETWEMRDEQDDPAEPTFHATGD